MEKEVHRLEYIAFHPKEDMTGKVINHIDGDKTNDLLTNLESITYQENNLHAEYIIKTHNCSKPVLMLDKNYNVIKEFPSLEQAQRETGASCLSRNIKKGYYWKYKD